MSKAFPGTSAPAVDSIDLDVSDGEFVAFLGPSGCGKSTTLRMIAGLERPDKGRILFGDEMVVDCDKFVYRPPEKRNLGMVFQSYAIWPHMTVAQNVGYPLRMRRVGKSETSKRVDEVLELVNLSGYRDRPAPKLSGGQQQRVALARALVFEPQLLLLDEPLSNLDAKLRDQMRLEIAQLQERVGITTIYVTHDQDEALTLADRVVIMNNGKIEQVAAPTDVYGTPASKFVAEFIGKCNFTPIDDVVRNDDDCVAGSIRDIAGTIGVVARAAESLDRSARSGVLGIRPEWLNVVDAQGTPSPGAIRLTARVRSESFLGDHWEYTLDVGSPTPWRIFLPVTERLHPGHEATLEFPSNMALVY